MMTMIPRPPAEPPPQVRGGFFRALGILRQQEAHAADFKGAVPTGSASPKVTDADELGRAHASPQHPVRSNEELSASLFLEKLKLKFIETIWVEIKKNCMLTTSGRGAGANETINLADFLRVSKNHMDYTPEDLQYLERLFNRVDRRKKGAIRTTDIATALVLISNDDPIPKLRSLFRVFDSDDDSCLMMDEIFDMYLSIKVNNITRTRDELLADALFDDELSLQEAKRLYELTVVHLKAVTDFIIFDEFKHIFNEKRVGRFLLESLLPGAFSLEWILSGDVEPHNLEADRFGSEVRKGLVTALRRGEEHLDLSRRRGRGTRIMQSCLSAAPHRPPPGDSKSQGGAAGSVGLDSLPKLELAGDRTGGGKVLKSSRSARASVNQAPTNAASSAHAASTLAAASGTSIGESKRDAADDHEAGSEATNSDEDEDGMMKKPIGHGHNTGPGGGSYNRGGGMGGASSGGGGVGVSGERRIYSIEEARELPQLPVHTLNHPNAKLFRTMKLDAKTQQAYLRDRKDVNRTLRYQCLVCAVNHDFMLSKCGGEAQTASAKSAEHQH